MKRGVLHLNKEIKEIMEKASERAGRLGFHIVHMFHKDIISGEFSHRSGYFESLAEAELFSQNLVEGLDKAPTTALILLDGNIVGGKLTGDDAKAFMAAEDAKRWEYVEVLDKRQ